MKVTGAWKVQLDASGFSLKTEVLARNIATLIAKTVFLSITEGMGERIGRKDRMFVAKNHCIKGIREN